MKKIIKLLLVTFPGVLFGQDWVDTIYQIHTIEDIYYGEATDFAGNEESLAMDISYPLDDSASICKRPLLVLVHGGAFLTGDKADPVISRLRTDFAKRGYVTASVNYRLGQFQTHHEIHCNISNLGVEWDCLNMTDSSEWYRAYYRGVQDVNGAIRFLINHAEDYAIAPDKVFVAGESAGGFIAMGVGFINDMSEVLLPLIEEMPDVQAPNTIYEAPCIQAAHYHLDTSIASMNLSRPDLGDYRGTLNFPLNEPYQVRAVGSFYGGAFNTIFGSADDDLPALYLYHQPGDLIVPYGYNRVFAGYAWCATQFPFFCQNMINRPLVYGSKGIEDILLEMENNSLSVPEYLLDNTGNNADCATQLLDPATQAHALDNFWLRTSNMAAFFASRIDSCATVSTEEIPETIYDFQISPNPVLLSESFWIEGNFKKGDRMELFDVNGLKVYEREISISSGKFDVDLSTYNLGQGIYFVRLRAHDFTRTKKLLIMNSER